LVVDIQDVGYDVSGITNPGPGGPPIKVKQSNYTCVIASMTATANKIGKNSVMASPQMYLSAIEGDRKVEIIYTVMAARAWLT